MRPPPGNIHHAAETAYIWLRPNGAMRGGRREAERAHDERDGGRGPAPRQCLEQDRLSTENVKPLRASVTEGDKEKGGTKITA